MRRTNPHPDMPVDEIMRRWPATIRLFLDWGMICVGCPIGAFHTVADACLAHGLDLGSFEALLSAAMADRPAARGAICDDGSPPGGPGHGDR